MYIIVCMPVHMHEGQKRMASVLYLLFRVSISPGAHVFSAILEASEPQQSSCLLHS